jgi:hypothetical protein
MLSEDVKIDDVRDEQSKQIEDKSKDVIVNEEDSIVKLLQESTTDN